MIIEKAPQNFLKSLDRNRFPKKLSELHTLLKNGTISPSERKQFDKLFQLERIRTFNNYVKSMDYPIDYQWFHQVVIDKIDEIIESKVSRRLLIEMPPRHCKTLLAGLFLSTYLFGRFPEKCIIYATAVNEKAEAEAANMRDIITSPRYQELFPGAKVKSSLEDIAGLDKAARKNKKDTATVLSNVYSDRGQIRTAGMGDMLSGYPGHFLIADDLYKGYAEAQSDKIRESIWQWFWSVFLARADKATVGGCAHVIAFSTRWDEDDIWGRIQRIQAGHAQERENVEKLGVDWYDWEVISFEAIKTSTKISHPSDTRKEGEYLWPLYASEYHSQKTFNPVTFEAIYQGNPVNKLGKLFERSDFQEYERLPENINRILICIDPNLKEANTVEKNKSTASSDNFAIVVLGMNGQNIYLLDFLAKAKDYNVLKQETLNMIYKYPYYSQLIIEQTASGPALTSDLKISGFLRITEFSPGSKSKFEKAQIAIPEFRAGRYFVPSRKICSNIEDFINQHLGFTGQKGRRDDYVDANVIGIIYYLQNKCLSNITMIQNAPIYDNKTRSNLLHQPRVNMTALLPGRRGGLRR